VPAAVLAALAVLTKQTLLAPALAGGFWLWSRDRRAALRFAGLYLGLVLGTCATLELTTGAFFSNAADANVNPFSLAAVGPNVATFLLFQGGIAVVAGITCLPGTGLHRCRPSRPLPRSARP
jgi:hypothetical protein